MCKDVLSIASIENEEAFVNNSYIVYILDLFLLSILSGQIYDVILKMASWFDSSRMRKQE